MWGIAFADAALPFLGRWAVRLLVIGGAAAGLYFWAYDRGRDAERVKWQTAATRLMNAANELMGAIDERMERDAEELAAAREAFRDAASRSRTEREIYYADPGNPNPVCFTPARVVRREAVLAELAESAGGADRDRGEVSAGADDAGQGKGREPEGKRGRGDD